MAQKLAFRNIKSPSESEISHFAIIRCGKGILKRVFIQEGGVPRAECMAEMHVILVRSEHTKSLIEM